VQLGSGEEAEYDLGEEKDGGKNDAKKGRDKVQPLDSFEFGGSETHSEDAERGNNNNRKVSIKCPRKAPPTWRQMQSGGRYEERRGVGDTRRGEGGSCTVRCVCWGGGGALMRRNGARRECATVYTLPCIM
jgi:hypothetical protein